MRFVADQEKAQRTLVQRAARDSKEVLTEQAQTLADNMDSIESRLQRVEEPWWKRLTSCFCTTGGRSWSPYDEMMSRKTSYTRLG